MDVNQRLQELALDGSDQSMVEVHQLVTKHPSFIPKGMEILSERGTDVAISLIFQAADANPEYVPNGIAALAESGNSRAPVDIFNLVNAHPKTAHMLQALDALGRNAGNHDVTAISEILGRYPDFVPEGFAHLSKIGTQQSFQAIVDVMGVHKEYESFGLQTLKEHGGELADKFHKRALENITHNSAHDKAVTGAGGQQPGAARALPAKRQAQNYGLKPEQRLDLLAQDGSDKAVMEMYRIVTNYTQHIPKGLTLLGQVDSDKAVNLIKQIATAHPEHVGQAIDVLGACKNDIAPIEMDELVRRYPEPAHISRALSALGAQGSRHAVIAIGEIMKERPDHLDEGYKALRQILKDDHEELVIEIIDDVMAHQPGAVAEGLVILTEEDSPQAMEVFDRVLEGITGVDLTSPRDAVDHDRFCAGIEDFLAEGGIDRPLDDPPEDDIDSAPSP